MSRNQLSRDEAGGALDLFCTERDGVPETDPAQFSLWQYAHETNRAPLTIRKSFEMMARSLPTMWAHVEIVRTRSPLSGAEIVDYRLDAAAFMAFLYWKERRGRFPAPMRRIVL